MLQYLSQRLDQTVTDLDMKKFVTLQLLAHTFITALFVLLTLPTLLWWKNSLPWLQFLSIFAIVWTGACGMAGAVAAVFALRAEEATEIPSLGIEAPDPAVTTSQL
jgi:hypothetical protein